MRYEIKLSIISLLKKGLQIFLIFLRGLFEISESMIFETRPTRIFLLNSMQSTKEPISNLSDDFKG